MDVSGFTRLSQTTDNATLTVTGSFNGIQRILLENTSATISAGAGFRFNNDTGLKTQLFLGSTVYTSGANTLFVDGVSSRIEIGSRTSNVDINTVSLGVANTKLRVFNNGNVGVGSNPTDAGYRLDVSGTTRISGTELRLDNGTTGVINLFSTTPEIRFFSADPTGYRLYRSGTAMFLNAGGSITTQISGNDAYTLNASSGHIWRTALSGGAALARLTTGGNLIVGGTTDAGQRFQVNGTTRLTGDVTIVTTTNARQLTFENSTLRAGVNISQPNNTLTFNNGNGFELNSNNVTFFTSANTYFKGFQGGATFSYVNGSNVAAWSTLPDASVPYAWGRKLCLTGGTTITVPNASAVLDIQSTTMGFLPPRMTGAQAELIGTPAAGLLVYSTDGSGATITSLGWWGYNGTTWVKLN